MAATVTKHAYETTAAAATTTLRNVESANGKIMHATTSNAADPFDWPKQEAIKQQRKLRLTQVSRAPHTMLHLNIFALHFVFLFFFFASRKLNLRSFLNACYFFFQ